MSIQQRRTPEVTYTFEGESGKYVRLEDYTHDVLQWVHLTEALQSRMAELESALGDLLRDGIVLSRNYLETFKDRADDDTVQGWHKRDWIKARKAADKARQTLFPKEPK